MLKRWGLRKVQGLLSQAAIDPVKDPLWSVVGDGVDATYFLGKAKEEINLITTQSNVKDHLILAIRYLILYYVKTHDA